MSESTPKVYDALALQRLYQRLHQHYLSDGTDGSIEDEYLKSHYTVELIDPEAFYRELATFALWIMTEPTSERTQALAKQCDEILTATHNDTIRGLTDGQIVNGCVCMEQYIQQKCQNFRAHLVQSGLTESERTASEDSLEKWTDRLTRLR